MNSSIVMKEMNVPNASSSVNSNAIQYNYHADSNNFNYFEDADYVRRILYSDDSPSLWIKIIAALCLVVMYFILKKCKQNWTLEDQRREEERRRRREEEEKIAQRKCDPNIRKSLISMHIDTRKIPHITTCTQDIVTCTPCTNKNEATEDEVQNETSQNHSTCPICLKAFERGEDISWSKQLVCRHVFHKDCLTPWLMMHDDCPLCRCKMVYDSTTKAGDNLTKPSLGSRWQHPNNQNNEVNTRDTNDHNDSLHGDDIEKGLFIQDGMILFDRPRQEHSSNAQCHISYDDISENNQSIQHTIDSSVSDQASNECHIPAENDDHEYDEEEAVVANTMNPTTSTIGQT